MRARRLNELFFNLVVGETELIHIREGLKKELLDHQQSACMCMMYERRDCSEDMVYLASEIDQLQRMIAKLEGL